MTVMPQTTSSLVDHSPTHEHRTLPRGRVITHDRARVVLADTQPVVRVGLRAVLAASMVTVVAESTSAHEAAHQVRLHRPDVLLLDPGLVATPALGMANFLRMVPDTAVLVFATHVDDVALRGFVRAGVRGVLLKSSSDNCVIRAVRGVAAGEAAFCPAMANRLSALMAPVSSTVAFPELTNREREILNLIAAGLGNRTIAARLGLSPKTVSNNLSMIFSKLRLPDRSAAIVAAREHGLGTR